MIKMMMAAAGLSIGLMMLPVAMVPAKAGVNVDINIGGRDRISCGRGRNIVENHGFRNVRPRSCDGRIYRYLGRRHGDMFMITLDSRRGRIVDVHRMRY